MSVVTLLNAVSANTTGPVAGLGTPYGNLTLAVTTTGTVSAFSVQLLGSLDGQNYESIGSAVTSTTAGESVGSGVLFQYFYATLTGYSGTGTVTAELAYSLESAASGGGGGPPSGAAGGDLSGTYPNPAVAQLNGNALNSSATRTALGLGTAATQSTSAFDASGAASTAQVAAEAASVSATVMTTLGDSLYGGASGAATRLAGNTTATRQFWTQTGTGSASAAPVLSTLAASDLTPFVGDWEPSDYGLLAWTYDPAFITTQHAATSETLFLVRVNVRQQVSCHNVVLGLQANGSGLTSGENFAGLYAGQANGGTWSAGSLIGSTADQTTAWESAGNEGVFAMALASGPFTLPAGFYWVAIQASGSGAPSFYEMANSVAPPTGGIINAVLGVSSARSCTNGTTRTSTLPSSITPSSNVVNISQWWAAIS